MQERLVRFQLFGQEFTFYSDAPEEEVESILALLRQELENNEKINRSSVPSSKMLVLGCLRMTAKYVELNREFREYRRIQERRLGQLVDKVASSVE